MENPIIPRCKDDLLLIKRVLKFMQKELESGQEDVVIRKTDDKIPLRKETWDRYI